MTVLELRGVVAGYLNEPVLRGVDLSVEPGEIVCILGPNGVGKTTLLKTVSGLLEPRAGAIDLEGESLLRLSPENRARRGLGVVPEGRRLFRNLTTRENLECGALTRRSGLSIDEVLELFPALAVRMTTQAGQLSGGEQQMLAIGRALRGGPAALLLDEPSLGLAPLVTREVFEVLRRLGTMGAGVVIAEQNVEMALSVGDRCVLLDGGVIAYAGSTTTPEDREEAKKAYMRLAELQDA